MFPMQKMMLAFLSGLFITMILPQDGFSADKKPSKETKVLNTVEERTRWMADGSYGLMVHYLISPSGNTVEEKTADLNRIINGFDLDYFMKQFKESGADWLIFTIGQNTGYYNNPNTIIDQLIPGRTPKRELVVEIAKAVKQMGKHFIAYLPAEMSIQSSEIQEVFHWNPEDQTEFLKTYLAFVEDYSRRLGDSCDGWWFDGCYESIHKDKWGWENWCKAARVGNPNAIIAFNDGCFCVGILKPVSPLQDYFAGEVHLLEDGKIRIDPVIGGGVFVDNNGKIRRQGQEPKFHMPKSRFIDGVQWHALVPVDSSFCPDISPEMTDYPVDELHRFISECKKVKGAVTLNVPIGIDGHIPDKSAKKLVALGKALSNK